MTIYGHASSYAETYAKEYNIKFVDIDKEPEDTTTPETEETTTTAKFEFGFVEATTTTPSPTPTATAAPTPTPQTTALSTSTPEETTTTTTTALTTQLAPAQKLIDKDTGVQLLASESVVEEGVELSVVIGNADISTDTHIYVLDITLVNEQGGTVQPNGNVIVKIPLPDGFEGSNTYYVYYQSDDGTLTDMNAVFENGYVVFTTNHFSTYILTTKKLIDDSTTTVTTISPATLPTTNTSVTNNDEDRNMNTGVVLLIIPALATATGIVISRKRK